MELFIQFALINGVIAMRTYQVVLKKSGLDQPRVELTSIGPGNLVSEFRTELCT
jgi:hypothetical protein